MELKTKNGGNSFFNTTKNSIYELKNFLNKDLALKTKEKPQQAILTWNSRQLQVIYTHTRRVHCKVLWELIKD